MEFENSAGLMNHLRTIVILADLYPNLTGIINLYNNLNNGCKCSYNSRVAIFNHTFNDLPNKLSQIEKDFLKTALNTDIIKVVNGREIKLN